MSEISNRLNNLWVERYRPQTLNDLCIEENARKLILSWGDDIPHLLFVSPPGQGKTTLARILVTDILKCDYLYINASDENGIDTVRNKIGGFVQTKSLDGNIKVVILDEIDAFSVEGQKALRNMMESYAHTSRFILTANYKHKVMPALQSRCQLMEIKPSIKQALSRCLDILKLEDIKIDNDQKKTLASLVKQNFPDLRKCIVEMQRNCIDGNLNIIEKTNTNKIVDKIINGIESKKSLQIRKYLIENDELFNSDWEQLLVDLLNQYYKIQMDDDKKRSAILTIADHLEKYSRVNDKEINFFACMLNLEEL